MRSDSRARRKPGLSGAKGPPPRPGCASPPPGSRWKRLGAAGDTLAVHLLHLSQLAAETRLFCPERAAPFFASQAETAVVTVTATSPVFRPHAVNTRQPAGERGVRAHHKPLPAGKRHHPSPRPAPLPGAAAWRPAPGADVTAARRGRPRPLVAVPRAARGPRPPGRR